MSRTKHSNDESLRRRPDQDLLIDVTNPQLPIVTPLARYDFGYGLARIDDPAGQRFVHPDVLGSTRLLTDVPAGTTAWAVSYTAFGEVVGTTASNVSRYGFASRWGYEDDGLGNEANDLGMLHVGARYYDPRVGRFVQRDPLAVSAGANVYNYAFGNPVNFADPSGLLSGTLTDTISTIGAAKTLLSASYTAAATAATVLTCAVADIAVSTLVSGVLTQNLNFAADELGLDRRELRRAVARLKQKLGYPACVNVTIDTVTGEIWIGDENIGNANDIVRGLF